ncbi:MAG: hypothetical protein COV59_03140 [Candidatus Magasanikbacteria bacterium CG11_big_fil_rev_8_21_14_0_20_39_34]|uniref:Peptidase S11 D-alanyl-D-alanine carboxypeptidase A N-terminal domain-containing protein n=1 Tax=Candidatus Magasanikbacteria bacterium CG11_big_fil_rev_8_21_14_0_20_39_34 TaxID=1974653 RepID=A0A2H0N5H5_9BACT|nr:MAG: hypothetical protein COV59_03140 [Candidatus Magasanikbacteria bacterium CG11_big_fil_rev_8_21_14_0_20_39_34]
MNKKHILPVLSLTLVSSLFPLLQALAIDEAAFNPNFIISDEQLEDSDSMSRRDIQIFLDDKNSTLANYFTEDANGKRTKASEIIYEAAQEYKINPKYILVKLQKEQSLITDPTPTQKQLDWAAGYGVCDSCSMSDPKIQKFKGFGKQVDNAAGIMRWYYENTDTQSWIHKPFVDYIIDGQNVSPQTQATAFLYTYTPHIHGNLNFWKLWNEWFNQTYPSGTLLKAIGSPDVFLIQDGKKRKITNFRALITRFDPKLIVEVPSLELSTYADGVPISFANYSILFDGENYFLLDNDYLRPFASAEVVRKLGYNPDEIISVNKSDLEGYPMSAQITTSSASNPAGKVIELNQKGRLYFLKDGVYHFIPNKQVAESNFPGYIPEKADLSILDTFQEGKTLGFKDGTLIQVQGFNKIYVIENGKKRHIPNEKVFLSLGYKWENVIPTDLETSLLHEDGLPIEGKQQTVALQPASLSSNITITPTPNSPSPTPTQQNPLPTPTKNGLPVFQETGIMYETPGVPSFVGTPYDTKIDSYLIADYDSLQILEGKNVDSPRPLASLTKVMAAYTMLEEGLDRSTVSIYDGSRHKASYHRFRIQNGEAIRNQDLLYSMLVSSLNTPSIMLADSLATPDIVVSKMNANAKNWNLSHSQFADTSGLDLQNFSTAREYLSLFKNTLENKELKRILSLASYEYEEVIDKDTLKMHQDTHSNQLKAKTDLPFTITASKTGYLYESGFNLTMVVQSKLTQKKYIIILLGNPDYTNRFKDAEAFARWALAQQ